MLQKTAWFWRLGFIFVLLGGIATRTARAINRDSYDLDSLTYLSTDIVEAQFTLTGFKISHAHLGSLQGGQRIATDLNGYRKYGSFFASSKFGVGDRFFLFLSRSPNSTSEEASPIASGVAYICRGRVYRFSQVFNPGPYVAGPECFSSNMTAPSVAEFRQSIHESIARTTPWRTKFAAAPSPKDVPWLLALLKEKAKLQGLRFFDSELDALGGDAARRLVIVGSFQNIEQALAIDPGAGMILNSAFTGPHGVEFLYNALRDMSLPSATRLALTGGIDDLSWTAATRPSSDPVYGRDKYHSQLAELIAINAFDEAVVTELVRIAGNSARFARDYNRSKPVPEAKVIAHALRDLFHRPSTSERLRYAIEQAMLNFSRAEFEQLGSKCGPIPSLAKPVDVKMYAAPSRPSILLGYEFSTSSWQDPVSTLELVVESTLTGTQFVVPGGPKIPNTPNMGSGGGDFAPMPPGLTPGTYRLFYRFKNGAEVVGEGHYFETTLPQQFQGFPPGPAMFLPPSRSFRLPWGLKMLLIISLTATPPILLGLWIGRAQRRRIRFKTGLCIQCGYDLRASTDRCPECQAGIPQQLDLNWWKRPLLQVAMMVATVVAVASATTWIRSYFAGACVDFTTIWGTAAIYITRGALVLENGGPARSEVVSYSHDDPRAFPRSAEEAGAETGVRFAGVEISPDANLVIVPCWLVLGVGGCMILVLKRSLRLRQRVVSVRGR